MKSQGYMIIVDPSMPQPIERDTFTCCHCNRIVIIELRAKAEDIGGVCTLCMKNVCPTCAGKECYPFEQQLERMEARDKLLRSIGI